MSIHIKCEKCKRDYHVNNDCIIKMCYCGEAIEVKDGDKGDDVK